MKPIFTLLLLCAGMFVFGQKTITGKITNEAGDTVPSASITITEPNKDAIIAYAISNSKGEYKLNYNSDLEKIEIKIKAFNHKPYLQTIKNVSQTLSVKLQTQATEIKEVVLKAKIITAKGDTINYDLKAFENQSDRSLADVLKKMPGFEVLKNGTILHQGKPLSKFYVNGKDLMEGGYGVVNNALPKDAVAKVQVMENHQPVKILQDKIPSDQSAINVVLKKKVTMTGRGEVGAGMSPFLWNVKLTPMFFGQNAQWVLNYKTNNSGEAVENEANILAFGNRFEGFRQQAAQRQWLGINAAGMPPVDLKRYLMNTVHSFSGNILLNPFKNKEWELKANAVYVNNAVDRTSQSKTTTILTDGAQYTVDNSSVSHFYTDKVRGELIFMKNAKKGFFKNVTSWNSFWQRDKGILSRTAYDKQLIQNQSAETPTFILENSLSSIIPYKEKLINVQSYFKYQKDRNTLKWNSDANPLLPIPETGLWEQQLTSSEMKINHLASLGFTWKKWTLTPEIGLNMDFNALDSDFYTSADYQPVAFGKERQNRQKWSTLNPYTQLSLNLKTDRLNLNIGLPLNFYGYALRDNLHERQNELNKTVFEPSFFANYNFASFFKWYVFGSMKYNLSDFGDIYYGSVFTTPTQSALRNFPFQINKSSSIGSSLEYRNPLNNLFFNVRYRFNENKNQFVLSTVRDLIGNIKTDFLEIETKPRMQSLSAEVGKYFPALKTNLSVNYSRSESNAFSAVQYLPDPTMLLRETKRASDNAGLKFNNAYFSWLSIDYLFTLGNTRLTNTTENLKNTLRSYTHNLSVYLYPSKSHTLGFFLDNASQNNAGRKLNNTFMDASYQYTWEKRKIDFELKWMNILNKKAYDEIFVSADNRLTSINHYDLRPSQIMLSVKFNFK